MGNRRFRFALPGAVIFFGVAALPAEAFFGDFDPGFDGDGRVTTSVGAGDDAANDVAVQSDGKIVAVGETNTAPGFASYDFAVVRYNTDGSLDTSFGGDGIVTTDFAGSSDQASGVAIQADGKVVVVGISLSGTGRDHAVARYNTNGTPDMGFDTDGKLTTAVAPGTSEDGATGVAVQSDGKIVVNGFADMGAPSDYDFTVLRYDTGGTLDPVFLGEGATAGTAIYDFAGEDDESNEVAIQTDGKIVVGGSSELAGNTDFALIRLHASSGKRDTDDMADLDPLVHLDGDGRATTAFGAGSDAVRGLTLQADGKIVATGFAGAAVGTDAATARYNPNDGSLDTSFDGDGGSGNGKVTTSFVSGANVDSAQDVVVQPDGKVVIAGLADIDSGPGSNFNFALARYNGADGTLDTSFAGDGTATPPLLPGSAADGARSVALEAGGNILAAGFADVFPVGDFGVGRFGPTVTVPDTTITSGPSGLTGDATPTFAFTSTELGSSFECRVIPAAFAPCSGSESHTNAQLSAGSYTFEVRATDPFSHTDASPAQRAFTLLACGGETATIAGDAGANNLTGTAGRDVVAAGAGNDKVRGLGAGDLLCGGAGKDRLIGGPGNDRLLGEQGKDTLIGGKGKDRLIGGAGKDVQRQ